jgi:hypothetical protein
MITYLFMLYFVASLRFDPSRPAAGVERRRQGITAMLYLINLTLAPPDRDGEEKKYGVEREVLLPGGLPSRSAVASRLTGVQDGADDPGGNLSRTGRRP